MFGPKWVKKIPKHLRPDSRRAKALDAIRLSFSIPEENFILRIVGSPAITIRVQRTMYERFRQAYPSASEKELCRKVLISRLEAPPADKFNVSQVDEMMQGIETFEDLCTYIVRLDASENQEFIDFNGLGKAIDEILV